MVQTIANLKRYMGVMKDSLADFKKEHPGQPFTIHFSLEMAPGLLNESETLSYVDKVSRALGQFNEQDAAKFDLRLMLVNPLEEAWSSTVQRKAGIAQELDQNAQDAKKLILPPTIE